MYKENHSLVGEAINAAISIFDYAVKGKVKKVVFASSSSIYNELPMPSKEDMEPKVTDYYTEARICIERLAKLYHVLYGMESVGLRFFSIYGFHEEAKGKFANVVSQFLWQMRKDEAPVIFGDGNQTRDFTFIDDIVIGTILAAEADVINGEIFNLGFGHRISVLELAKLLQDLLNKHDLSPIHEPTYPGEFPHTQADISKAKRICTKPMYCVMLKINEGFEEYKSRYKFKLKLLNRNVPVFESLELTGVVLDKVNSYREFLQKYGKFPKKKF